MPGPSTNRLQILPEVRCWSKLRSQQHGVGRIAFGAPPPELLPVNYVVDVHDVVIATHDGIIREAARRGDEATFEVDAVMRGASGLTGWSVVCRGPLREATEDEAAFLSWARLQPAPGGFKPVFVRMAVRDITGRTF